MFLRRIGNIILFAIVFSNCVSSNSISMKKTFIDIYHNDSIKDPYRFLENLEDSSVVFWLRDQEDLSKNVVNNIKGREIILNRQKENEQQNLFDIKHLNITNDDSYFYLKRLPEEKVGKLYKRKGFEGKEEMLLDPLDTKFNIDVTETYINYIKPSWDASKVVIAYTKNDEEFSKIRVLDVKKKTLYPEIIDNNWPAELGGVVWLSTNDKFIYSHLPNRYKKSENPLFDTSSVLYKLGDNPTNFKVLLSKNKNPNLDIKRENFPITFFLNEEKTHMFAAIAGTTFSDWYYKGIDEEEDWVSIVKKENKISWFEVKGDSLIYLTSQEASNFKLCKTSFSNPDFSNPIVLVKEDSNEVLEDFVLTKDGIFYTKIRNGVEAKLFYLRDNIHKEIQLPKRSGSISITSGGSDFNDLWVEIEGWINKKERYRYDIRKDSFIKENLVDVKNNTILNDVEVEEIEIESYDGTLIPLSIIHKKGIKLNGNNRVLINGYGAYGWSNSPYLYPYLLHWLAEDGIYAVAHVRGGGEKGEAWHKAGQKQTKPNTWKDFIACTEYLIDKGYTNPSRIAAWGASAGGITIGRAITERPDLYQVAIIKSGSLNKLRSEFSSNGPNNIKEFGTVKNPEEFKALLEMDAYHHIEDGVKYPAIYLTAGMNDTRVPAWQPAKFAVRMQEATTSGKPVLLSVDFEGGHGFEATQDKKNKELADILSFALWQTGHPDYQLKE